MPLSKTDPRTAHPTGARGLGLLYLLGGLTGLAAAVVLLLEKIELIKDPDYIPTCSINPVLSCGSIMSTPQAEAFGFPNSIIGIIGFSALSMLAVVLLTGIQLPRWLWLATQISVTLAMVFIHWLIYQSLYVIGALCPYCMIVWVVNIAVFWWTTVHSLIRRLPTTATHWGPTALGEYRGAVLTAWYLVIVLLIAHRFWDYWVTLA